MNYSKLLSKRDKSETLYGSLRSSLESAIESGELPAGTRLPSERDLAARLKLSRTTVVNAYRELESRGLVRSHVGRGTFVCASPEAADAPFAWRGKVSARVARIGAGPSLRHLIQNVPNPDLISFAVGGPALECFPLEEYRRVMERILRRKTLPVLGLSPTEGQPLLRKLIAARFGTRPERVLILSGSQQGLDLVARCLLDPGDAIVMDRPGYVGAIQTFRAAGADIFGWDAARSDFGELEDLLMRHRPKLIYTDPTFQNPTGRVLSLRDRHELLKLAARYRVPVIEDNPWQDTYLDAPPPPSLYHLDVHNIVIHLDTFSKVLAPGLRIGWLVAPEYVVGQLASIKQYEDISTDGLAQLVVADFLQSGLFDEHLLASRKEHARKRATMKQALERHIPGRTLEFNRPGGGLHFWCRLNKGINAQRLLHQAIRVGVIFAPGEMFYADASGSHEMRLCFTSVPLACIEEGVKRLRAALDAVLSDNSHDYNLSVPLV